MEIKSQKISANLALNEITLPSQITQAVLKQEGKNVIFAVDVSGSMSWDLPKMRQQLKNRIPDLINEQDTISIIWFSGRGQAGILKEGVKVKNLEDLQNLNNAIDRFLKPVGLTAFLPPLELTEQVIKNLAPNGNNFSFIFLSDGYNNDSVWSDVVKKVSELEDKVHSATFIEYGYYADSNALTEMSELIGGEKIFAQDFDSYSIDFEKIFKKDVEKKIEVDISSIKDKLRFKFIYAYNVDQDSITVFSANKESSTILVPQNVTKLYFISRYKVDSLDTELDVVSKLVAVYLLADRLKYNQVEDFLAHIGDVDLLNTFAGAFGKQKLNAFKQNVRDYAFIPNLLYANGKREGYKVDPKQFCIIDLLNLLQEGDNKFYPYHPDFNYKRISAKTTQKVELTDEAKEQLKDAKTLKEIQKITADIESPEFVYPENEQNIGFSFDILVWNQDRANISVQTKLPGKVKLPKNVFGLKEVDSFIYRNFTIVADGIVNVTEIPVTLDSETRKLLFEKGLISGVLDVENMYMLDISSLPIINRSMTLNISGKKLANIEFDLIKVQAAHKYLKELKKEYAPRENQGTESYSKEAADWLKSIGIDDFNGFSPKKEKEETSDFYIATELKVGIQNLSGLPKTSDVFAKVEAFEKAKTDDEIKTKDFTVSEGLYKSQIDEIGGEISTSFNYAATDPNTIDIAKIVQLERQVNQKRRQLLYEIARIKFGVILSRTWFSEFESMEEDTLEGIKFKGIDNPLKVKFQFKDKQINV